MSPFMQSVATLGGCVGIFTLVVSLIEVIGWTPFDARAAPPARLPVASDMTDKNEDRPMRHRLPADTSKRRNAMCFHDTSAPFQPDCGARSTNAFS